MRVRLNPLPTGLLQGDDRPIPDRGTGTAVTETYGASIGPDATNSMGRITGIESDAPFDNDANDARNL